MNVLIVYAHPNPKSFNHAILEAVTAGLDETGHTYQVKDLYEMNMKVVLDGADFAQLLNGQTPPDIKREQDDLVAAQGLIFIYPVWWWDRPAILKGWVDRVLQHGFAFQYGPGGVKGLLRHEKAIVFQTYGNTSEVYDAQGVTEIPVRIMTDGTLRYCGVKNVTHQPFYGVTRISDDERKKMLEQARDLAKNF